MPQVRRRVASKTPLNAPGCVESHVMPKEIHKLYNGEITLEFDQISHLYTVDGKRVAGVTGATGTISKPALVPWAAKMAAEYIEKRLLPGIAYDEIQIHEMLEGAKYAHGQSKETAASKGKMIHEWIEDFIKGKNPPPPVNEELKRATEAFVKWTKEHKTKFILSEKKVYSKFNNYAGTFDFTAEIDGSLVMGDIKTSSGIYDEMFFQTAAYQCARQEEFPEEKYAANIIVRCGKDGALEIAQSEEYEKNLNAFLGALAIYNRQQELRDRKFEKLLEIK